MSDPIIAESITPESIKAEIYAAIPGGIDTREGSYIDNLTGPIALEIWKAYQSLNSVASIVYLDADSPEDWIIRRCGYYGIEQKPGTAATAVLTVSGAKERRRGGSHRISRYIAAASALPTLSATWSTSSFTVRSPKRISRISPSFTS